MHDIPPQYILDKAKVIIVLFLESNIEAKEPVIESLGGTIVGDSAIVVPIIVILSRIFEI